MRRDPLIRQLRRFLRDESGATAIEYAHDRRRHRRAFMVGVIATLGGKVTDHVDDGQDRVRT